MIDADGFARQRYPFETPLAPPGRNRHPQLASCALGERNLSAMRDSSIHSRDHPARTARAPNRRIRTKEKASHFCEAFRYLAPEVGLEPTTP
ncbi:hypothetical protein [Pseudomonas sp. CGJS7]|uniref:hypothetical protein n=1 Tax=Pseudomonas sp. CGJS7 TaxID=3109348 RepID=UPI0030090978